MKKICDENERSKKIQHLQHWILTFWVTSFHGAAYKTDQKYMLDFDPNNINPIILDHFPLKDFNIYEIVKIFHYTHKGCYVICKK